MKWTWPAALRAPEMGESLVWDVGEAVLTYLLIAIWLMWALR